MQRVRMLLPFLPDHGWQPEVLAVEPGQVAAPLDSWLEDGLPQGLPVHRVEALGLRWARLPGLGNLGFRALHALSVAGGRLLAVGDYDLVYFSTTVFEIHVLGPRWKRRWGVPFVMDYQDPWVTDYYREHPEVRPPGGRLKYTLLEFIHRRMEPRVLQECSGFTSVSPAYPGQLIRRYPALNMPQHLILPFPGSARDLAMVRESGQSQFDGAVPGTIHWLYAGVLIPGMLPALRSFFQALRDFAPGDLLERLCLHFVGTTYAGTEGGHDSLVRPVADAFGLSRIVKESPARIPYSQVLAMLQEADGLLVFGSDDTSYTASKIYPCLMARKPLLAVVHEESSVVDLLQRVGGGTCVSFATGEDQNHLARRIGEDWCQANRWSQTRPLDEPAFAPFTETGSAKLLAGFFDKVIGMALD